MFPPKHQYSQQKLNSSNTNKKSNECYYCHRPWVPGHRCKNSSLHVIEMTEDPCHEDSDEEEKEESDENGEIMMKEIKILKLTKENPLEAKISLNALQGESCAEIFKLEGTLKGRRISILLDTGSNTSFLDSQVTKKAQIVIIPTLPLTITVANG
jgi:hypothetical protein